MLACGGAAQAAPNWKAMEPLKHPIVLVHGSTASGANLTIGPFNLGPYWAGIAEEIGATGTEVKIVHLPTDASIGERAAVLKNFLETDMKGQMVNIVGHSLGGLDARYAATVLGSNQMASITTIGTPHLGSPLADWAAGQIDRRGLWYWFLRLIGYDMKHRRFLKEITTSAMKHFNDKVPNRSDVRYFSVRTKGSFRDGTMSYFLWLTSGWLEGQGHHMSANGHDGLVPFDSQAWGRELPVFNLDHLAQINHHEFKLTSSKQESIQLYFNIYQNLAAEGL